MSSVHSALLGVLPLIVFVMAMGVRAYSINNSRSTILFGYTVPPGFRDSPAGQTIVRSFQRRTMFLIAIVLTAIIWGANESFVHSTVYMVAVPLGLLMFGQYALYFQARRATEPHRIAPPSRRAVVVCQTPEAERMPGGLWLNIGPYVMVMLAAIWLVLHWHALPEQRVGKSAIAVAAELMAIFAMSFRMHLPILWHQHARRFHEHAARARSVARWILAYVYLSACLLGFFLLVPVYSSLYANPWPISLAGLMFVIICMALVVWNRFLVKDDATMEIGDRTDDRHWYWGMYYYNPDDPALFVETRLGKTYTVNLARPMGMALEAAPVILLLVSLVFLWP